ncbi:MAG: CoA-binding protein [Cyclobacteriaceae bacterium]
MIPLQKAVDDFFAAETFAIAGYSRTGNSPANIIYQKLQTLGKTVYAINPAASEINGINCYQNIASIGEKVQALVIAAHPKATVALMQQAIDHGVRVVWIHKSIDGGSFDAQAIEMARQNQITLIPSGCPMMFCKNADLFHKCMGWFMKKTGKIPATLS